MNYDYFIPFRLSSETGKINLWWQKEELVLRLGLEKGNRELFGVMVYGLDQRVGNTGRHICQNLLHYTLKTCALPSM